MIISHHTIVKTPFYSTESRLISLADKYEPAREKSKKEINQAEKQKECPPIPEQDVRKKFRKLSPITNKSEEGNKNTTRMSNPEKYQEEVAKSAQEFRELSIGKIKEKTGSNDDIAAIPFPKHHVAARMKVQDPTIEEDFSGFAKAHLDTPNPEPTINMDMQKVLNPQLSEFEAKQAFFSKKEMFKAMLAPKTPTEDTKPIVKKTDKLSKTGRESLEKLPSKEIISILKTIIEPERERIIQEIYKDKEEENTSKEAESGGTGSYATGSYETGTVIKINTAKYSSSSIHSKKEKWEFEEIYQDLWRKLSIRHKHIIRKDPEIASNLSKLLKQYIEDVKKDNHRRLINLLTKKTELEEKEIIVLNTSDLMQVFENYQHIAKEFKTFVGMINKTKEILIRNEILNFLIEKKPGKSAENIVSIRALIQSAPEEKRSGLLYEVFKKAMQEVIPKNIKHAEFLKCIINN